MVTDATDALSATLFALADPTRRAILAQLSAGDATVKDLAEPHAMSLAAVSKHLKVLESARLISRSKEAQWRPCHLQAEPLHAVWSWLEEYRRFWEQSLDGLSDYLTELQRTTTRTPNNPTTRTKSAKKRQKS
jgi:DNA-binding transcriptional ArsR family regulator